MWQDVMCNLSDGWSICMRNYDYDPDGGENSNWVVYPDIKLQFIQNTVSYSSEKIGTHQESLCTAMLPYFSVEEEGIVPEEETMFLRKNGVWYKVIAVNDWSQHPDVRCYYLELRREEIAD